MWGPTEKFPEISEFPQTTAHKDADALYALKSRGFGREIGVVSTNTKWCGAFLFGAFVLPIVSEFFHAPDQGRVADDRRIMVV